MEVQNWGKVMGFDTELLADKTMELIGVHKGQVASWSLTSACRCRLPPEAIKASPEMDSV